MNLNYSYTLIVQIIKWIYKIRNEKNILGIWKNVFNQFWTNKIINMDLCSRSFIIISKEKQWNFEIGEEKGYQVQKVLLEYLKDIVNKSLKNLISRNHLPTHKLRMTLTHWHSRV